MAEAKGAQHTLELGEKLIVRVLSVFPGVVGPVPLGPKGDSRTVQLADIVAVGRLGYHGSFVTYRLARLMDGSTVQLYGADLTPAVAAWLRKELVPCATPFPTRDWGREECWTPILTARPALLTRMES